MSFSVIRSPAVMVHPSDTTPSDSLPLSVIDKMPNLRVDVPVLFVYRHGGRDAAKVISTALSKALVPYYPLSGRLEESLRSGELQVACTGEGVWFVEATADCTLASLHYLDNTSIAVPHDKLLPIPQEDPILQMQVTRFACGGFSIGLTICHTVCDGTGTAQFLNAIGEFARGLVHPSIAPIWHREAVPVPAPAPAPLVPAPVQLKHEVAKPEPVDKYHLEHAAVTISADQINKLKNDFLKLTGKRCSAFDVAAANVWQLRTRALNLDQHTKVKLLLYGNARMFLDPPLPEGFYGNYFFPVNVVVSSGWLVRASNAEVTKLIHDAKTRLQPNFTKWLKHNDPSEEDPFAYPSTYTALNVLQWSNLGYEQVDYGWGYPLRVLPARKYVSTPVAIVGTPAAPNKGVCLTTWCVNNMHLPSFVRHLKHNSLSHL